MFDGKAFGEEMAATMRSYVDRAVEAATAPLKAELAELRARAVIEPKAGEPGRDGVDGRDGADGRDAEPVDPNVIADIVISEVDRALAERPSPQDGRDGRDGIDGKDGVGVAGALIDRDGCLVLTLSDGTVRGLGCVIGKDGVNGVDGAPGRNGFELSDFDTEMAPGGRSVLLKFSAGDTLETHELHFPVVLDKGVFVPGTAYEKGDAVTWGGSLWIAQEDTTDKPETSKAWRLAVKRGRDGKDAERA